jgi:ammonia channel protein AmtB
MDNELTALTTIFTEFYYWMTVVLMFLIHVGFCMYEVGASRYKHHQHTLMKNTLLIPLVTVTWFFFGWWIYWAFPTGPGIAPSIMTESTGLILGGGFGANELANQKKPYRARHRLFPLGTQLEKLHARTPTASHGAAAHL